MLLAASTLSHFNRRQIRLRYRFITVIATALAVVLLQPLPFYGKDANSVKRPNIVLILADDLGYGDLGCYGHATFRTPRLDRLAAEGARLTQFNTPMPYCAPTRASLLTGRYPFRHGLMGNPAPDGAPQYDKLGLDTSAVLLPQMLRSAGYATACIGKWHLGHQPQFMPQRRGFDFYLGIPYSNDMRPVKLFADDRAVEYPVVQANLTQRYTDRAIEFIRQNREQPFFLYLAHAMPHKPLAVSERYYHRHSDTLYADTLAELDANIGQLLDTLDELKLSDNTIVLFTSDNGPWYGGSSGGLRGMKSMTWEGGYRVPLLARWPNKIPAGHTSAALAGMIDLAPTLLKATQIDAPTGVTFDGRDLWPVLTYSTASPHEALIGSSGKEPANIRDQRWKLHVKAPGKPPVSATLPGRWIDPRGPDGVTILAPYEQYQPTVFTGPQTGVESRDGLLFDLQADPSEQHDLSAQHPGEVERLGRLFTRLTAPAP